MTRRQLLTGEERTALLGIPADPDALARLFTPSRTDRALVAERCGDANRLGCAVQLALLRQRRGHGCSGSSRAGASGAAPWSAIPDERGS